MKVAHAISAMAFLALSPVVTPTSATAQTAVAPEPDAARLVEARKLLDVILPPEARERMFRSMMTAMMANMTKALREDPNLAKVLGDVAVQDAFGRAIARQQQTMTDELMTNLPAMFEAMSRAYARRFSVDELRQIGAFFATPAGRAYSTNAAEIMSDPDIAAWQGQLMRKQMALMPAMMDEIKRDVEATLKARKPGKSTDGG